MSAATTIRYLVVAATAVTIMGGAASCGGDEPDSNLPPPASPRAAPDQSPSLDLSPAEHQAVDEARASFDRFMDAYVEVSTADIPTGDTAEALFHRVDEHLAGLLSQELRREIVGRWGDQQVVTGDLAWSLVRVLDVDLDREVDGVSFPQVTLAYCIDATGWNVAGEAGDKDTWRYAVSWSDDWFGQGIEGWRVVEREGLAAQPC